MIPHRTPFFLPLIYPSLIWRMAVEGKKLFLTFDDGPMPGPSEFVLDVLSRHAIQATFFCIGDNIRKHPTIFSAMSAGGHAIGNHTVNHLNGWRTDAKTYVANTQAFDAIASQAGRHEPTKLFRPPYGRITWKQIRMLAEYKIIMWDVISQDYDRNLSKEKCLRKTIQACRSGSVVVFHDSLKAQRNMEYTLPRLIEHFGAKDFQFLSL